MTRDTSGTLEDKASHGHGSLLLRLGTFFGKKYRTSPNFTNTAPSSVRGRQAFGPQYRRTTSHKIDEIKSKKG
jgi:hypothetical protein